MMRARQFRILSATHNSVLRCSPHQFGLDFDNLKCSAARICNNVPPYPPAAESDANIPPAPKLQLCQVNNHPNFRLQQAKARLEKQNVQSKAGESRGRNVLTSSNKILGRNSNTKLKKETQLMPAKSSIKPTILSTSATYLWKRQCKKIFRQTRNILRPNEKNNRSVTTVKQHGIKVSTNENPVRSNDGTSSGALSMERLRLARRRALERLARPFSQLENGHNFGYSSIIEIDTDVNQATCVSGQHSQSVREHGLKITAYENPLRSSDGTSSGGIVADRLRMARRKALENMAKPLPTDPMQTTTKPLQSNIQLTTDAVIPMSRKSSHSNAQVQEHGLKISAYENPLRSNDGTSSGGIVADRLRMARSKALESMTKPLPAETSETTADYLQPQHQFLNDSARSSNSKSQVQEHGLKITAYESSARSSDGISSGGIVADRLRIARRKVLENMANPLPSKSICK